MKINLSILGRLWTFDLAKQLQKRGYLNKLITSYPKFKTRQWNIPNNKVVSKLHLELITRIDDKTLKFYRDRHPFTHQSLARYAAKYMHECDIHIGWSGGSLEAIIKAKQLGKIFILERGATHYNDQNKLLQDERNKYGDGSWVPRYHLWQRELLEYELTDYISVPSSFARESFIKKGFNEDRILVHSLGVDLEEFKQVPKRDKTFRVIYAGRASFRKGFHYLMKAFYELNLPETELHHLGIVDDDMKDYIGKYTTNKVRFFGHINQNELYKYYSQGSVFVFPSLEDGFGLVLTQAMVCGLPIIATTNTGGVDLVTEDFEEGFIIPIRNVDALKEKITYLYNNQEECIKMGKKAKARVENGCSWDDYGDQYTASLEKIYNRHF